MGKSGKARKRQRKQQELLHVCDVDGQSSDSDQEQHGTPIPRATDVEMAVSVFQCLTRNRDELQSKGLKFLRQALFPLLEEQRTKHFENDPIQPPFSPEEIAEILTEVCNLPPPPHTHTHIHLSSPKKSPFLFLSSLNSLYDLMQDRISATIRVALFFENNLDVFQSAEYKPFRRALHPIVDIYFGKVKKENLINIISQAFRLHDWESALSSLYELQNSDSEIPKLGTLQRWVRDCDTVNDEHVEDSLGYSSSYLLILDAVMRVMIRRQTETDTDTGSKRPLVEKIKFSPERKGKLISYPIFSPSFETTLSHQIDEFNAVEFQTMFWVASTVPGNQRRPPQDCPLNIYALKFGAIQLGPRPHNTTR